MIEQLKETVRNYGGRAEIVSVEWLQELKNDINAFGRSESLNGFQKYIINDMYKFDLHEFGFSVRSVIVIASPVPAFARVIFSWQGEKIHAVSLARAYPGKLDAQALTGQYLAEFLKPGGYHIAPAESLPLKRLAVCSGLAEYGRNNICYVDGMGSFLTLVAYYSDIPCPDGNWREVVQMDCCDSCLACLDNCPTGALRRDRFLIDNERCLSYFNEGPGDFPEWLPQSVHHCLYDCLMCQNICPMNKDYIGNVIGPVEFDADETEALLSGKPILQLSVQLQGKLMFLGMDQWYDAMPRNIKVLFENYLRSLGETMQMTKEQFYKV